MKKILMQCCCALMILCSVPTLAFADALDDAKVAGQIGEQQDGYLGLVSTSAPASAKAIVADINQKRRAAYLQITTKNGQPLNVVETLAGQKLVERVPAGQYYQNLQGAWVKK